jgi:Ca-activated chloride channel family protein
MRRRAILTFAVALSLLGRRTSPQAAPDVPRFGARVEVVRVDVLVRGRGRPITGLEASAFDVEDDGVGQRVEQFSVEEMPLRLVLALDTSGSVRGQTLARLQRACLAAIGLLGPRDSAGLLTFAADVRLRAPVGSDPAALRSGLGSLAAEGGTALRDAAFATLSLGDATADRALGILFTDGGESASWLREAEVLEAARRGHVVLYGVRIGDEPPPFLARVVQISGGRVLRPASAEDLPSTFAEIVREFRTRYVLRYTPAGVARTGWHRVRVRLKRRSAELTYRDGYLVR